jgi:hypothetical protein
MLGPLRQDLTLRRGETFTLTLRWEIEPIVYKPITEISRSAPVRITSPGHGIPDGWRAAVTSVRGMREINATSTPPREQDYRESTVIDADTVEFNTVNSASFHPYASGGYLQYYTPADLDGVIARLAVKRRPGGEELLRLDTDNGGILVDAAAQRIVLRVFAAETEALAWTHGLYDLEAEAPDGTVTQLMGGAVRVIPEITT